MNRDGVAKMLSGALLGILLGLYIHLDQVRWSERGREAFLAYENHRFDIAMVHPRGQLFAVIGGVVLAALFCGVYELMAAGFVRLLPADRVEGSL